jgi:hypothetical protein
VDDWKRVMFSDESHFELRFGSQDPHCRRKKGSNLFAPEFTFKTIKHPPQDHGVELLQLEGARWH